VTNELTLLALTAASVGLIHTLIGPDHYLPFIVMARVRRWSLTRTLGITLACGMGHVLGSIVLGALGIALGWAVGGLEWLEGIRSEVAAWLLLGFGLAYTVWGIRNAVRNRPHSHWHGHGDGTIHEHRHTHQEEHLHVHETAAARHPPPRVGVTPWVLFVIFLFGPCEALIPILMYPAAAGHWWTVALVATVFALCTILTMLAIVAIGYLGVSRLAFGRLERYSHALAGLAIVACGLAIQLGL
jgi:nickel/cobalt exporter